MEHPINELFQLSCNSLKELITVDTIVGKTINMENGISIIPISNIKCSFATGGMETKKNKDSEKLPFGGATGGNVLITPTAFLVVNNSEVSLLHLENSTHLVEKVIEDVPEFLTSIKEMFSKNPKQKEIEIIEKPRKIKL